MIPYIGLNNTDIPFIEVNGTGIKLIRNIRPPDTFVRPVGVRHIADTRVWINNAPSVVPPTVPVTTVIGTPIVNMPETGNQMRRRKGNEMREGKRPYPKYPSKESRIADTSGRFDEKGEYVYPEGSGFNWMEKIDPNSPWNCTGGKVS